MKRIGLALSGGGFRASLYHLGLVRFLRDAGLLARVSHVTAVSGGSIFAAHLLLNWDRYTGSPNEFDAAAAELLKFVRMDVRNRIARRYPLLLPFQWCRRLTGRSNRRLTRTGLLEYHYEKYLYGDVSLFELPERPHLHMLTTNLSEGTLCSFTRDGLWVVRRQPRQGFRIDRLQVGLATVATAVAASSAFPGFFPPLELTEADVGAPGGEFGRQAFTDGGVYDNLGVRMFRCLERPGLAEGPLTVDDLVDLPGVIDALRGAAAAPQASPLRRLAESSADPAGAERLPIPAPSPSPDGGNEPGAEVLARLTTLLWRSQLHLDPYFANLNVPDPDAQHMLQATSHAQPPLSREDQIWLNRHLLEAAFREATGRPLFRRLNSALDGVLVSDVGKSFEVQGQRRPGGLIRTALRATDILMDRVWQLEIETFRDAAGFVFAPVSDVVEPAEDPTALHPEIQRQAARIRTDLDRFSSLEIDVLARHGYCVGRKACRGRPDLFGADLPATLPWGPVAGQLGTNHSTAIIRRASRLAQAVVGPDPQTEAAPATAASRALRASAVRRIWITLLDWRDWASYIYVPLVILVLGLIPYTIFKSYERSVRISRLVDSLSQGSRDLDIMTVLLDGPMKPWVGATAEEVPVLPTADFTGFQIIQDSRIIDMRNWVPTAAGKDDPSSEVYGYRRLKVRKLPDNPGNNIFRIHVLADSPRTQMRFPRQELQPLLQMCRTNSASGEKRTQLQVTWNFENIPPGEFVDLIYEHYSPAVFLERGADSTAVAIRMQADTSEVTRWFLMPAGKEYKNYRILRYPTGKPEKAEPVKVVTEYLADDYTILAYKLIEAQADYTYKVIWYYK